MDNTPRGSPRIRIAMRIVVVNDMSISATSLRLIICELPSLSRNNIRPADTSAWVVVKRPDAGRYLVPQCGVRGEGECPTLAA